MAVRFLKYAVTDGETKARIWYSLDNRSDGRSSVRLYAKDYSDKLAVIFKGEAGYQNGTDIQTDYFEQGHVDLFEDHPLYAAARARAEANKAERDAKEVR